MSYTPESVLGCYIAHGDTDWIISIEDFDPEDYGLGPDVRHIDCLEA